MKNFALIILASLLLLSSCDKSGEGVTTAVTTALLTDSVTTTETPVTTEAPKETTKAPDKETTKAPAATTKAPGTTEAPKAQGGCGSAVAGSIAIIVAISLAGVMIAKKKD